MLIKDTKYQAALDKLAKDMIPDVEKSNKAAKRNGRPNPVIKYAMLVDKAQRPRVDFRHNAGIDMFAAESKTFAPSSIDGMYIAIVPTTFILELPYGVHGLVAGRSGNAFKRATVPFYGVIDNSYRGNTNVLLYTHSLAIAREGVAAGTAIAQLVLLNYAGYNLTKTRLKRVSVESLSETERGDKGFGSTGNNV